jgi:hypothetical protein
MVFTLTLPEFGEKRVKDLIIQILSVEWPLSLSQIHRKICKDYSLSVSCQGTYKAIIELLKNEILIKKDREYQIHSRWIKRILEFANKIEDNYSHKDNLLLKEDIFNTKTENNVTTITFDSILEMDKTWMNIKKEYYKNIESYREITFWEGNHCWWLLVYPDLEYEELEIIKQKKVRDFAIIHNRYELDLDAKKFYEKSGIKVKIIDSPKEVDTTVFGDMIMQVCLPIELKEKIELIYKQSANSAKVDIYKLLKEVLTKKTKISLTITKNKDIAEQLKLKILKEFKER